VGPIYPRAAFLTSIKPRDMVYTFPSPLRAGKWGFIEMAEELVPRKMISCKDVLKTVPVSRSTLARMIEDGRFPRAAPLARGRKAWFLDEIIEWQKRIERQRNAMNGSTTLRRRSEDS
jgi:predicted DNA-binding transcriptional regulator AlpA